MENYFVIRRVNNDLNENFDHCCNNCDIDLNKKFILFEKKVDPKDSVMSDNNIIKVISIDSIDELYKIAGKNLIYDFTGIGLITRENNIIETIIVTGCAS